MESVDIAVVGGGIAGLYFAWRLRNTGASVSVFESSDRVGGRIYTHIAPGGFPCEMGAMRLLPAAKMTIMHQVIQELDLPTVEFLSEQEMAKNSCKDYYEGKHTTEDERFLNTDEETLTPSSSARFLSSPPATMNWNDLEMKDGLKARNVTVSGVQAKLHESGSVNRRRIFFPESLTMTSLAAYSAFTEGSPMVTVPCGMSSIVEGLAQQITEKENMRIFTCHSVTMITEDQQGSITLTIRCADGAKNVHSKKLILACNIGGIGLIAWNSPFHRSSTIQKMYQDLNREQAIKFYLTYKEAWWEECGLYAGSIGTDLPIGQVTALGSRAKQGGYATLLASYTNLYPEVFTGLNSPDAEKFVPSHGESPYDITPSKNYVEFLQQQLKLVFGLKEIPDPVHAVCQAWNGVTNSYAITHYKVGADHNEMQWFSLKPFPDADIFMTGDTFPVMCKRGLMFGWSESSVMTSERVLVNHFGLEPFIQGLELQNEWPKEQ